MKEYEVVKNCIGDHSDAVDLRDKLNRLAVDGYRVISTISIHKTGICLIMERDLDDDIKVDVEIPYDHYDEVMRSTKWED